MGYLIANTNYCLTTWVFENIWLYSRRVTNAVASLNFAHYFSCTMKALKPCQYESIKTVPVWKLSYPSYISTNGGGFLKHACIFFQLNKLIRMKKVLRTRKYFFFFNQQCRVKFYGRYILCCNHPFLQNDRNIVVPHLSHKARSIYMDAKHIGITSYEARVWFAVILLQKDSYTKVNSQSVWKMKRA